MSSSLPSSSSSPAFSVESQLKLIEAKLVDIENKMGKLKQEKYLLLAQKESLLDQTMAEKSKKRAKENWSGTNFPWSKKMKEVMESVFNLKSLRPLQQETINATMSKQDVILIMPTGGGKSLCYQLPAFLAPGLTLVVSPLVALMEDQVRSMQKIGVNALMLSASSSKEDAKKASDALQQTDSCVRLVYVTPERLAKSKRFMNQLQKCAAQGRFARLAIDEVHCCSTWGHDFRPDYNYLGVLKDMFPQVPILGLTATSSAKVTIDVQKMLNIEGALVLRAPFNRPNLHYTVLRKPDQLDDCAQLIAGWAQGRYRGQTGIIYTTTIKDCESLATELKQLAVKVGVYHAMLEASSRSKTYERWISGTIQVVVATIAFGLGIDKPDVRFVIHHALSKSMEMLYQESGRAGRDGKPADCIILYRLGDVFKLSTMVFTQRTGLENLYGIVKYCLDSKRCRRSLIADHFDEVWDEEQCRQMCDHCCATVASREMEVANHCRSMYRLLDHAANQDRQLTAIKLIDAWLQQGEVKLRLKDVKAPSLDRVGAEAVLAQLVISGYLKEDFHYTAYSTISYLRKGPKCSLLEESIKVTVPKLASELEEPSKRVSAKVAEIIKIEKISSGESTLKRKPVNSPKSPAKRVKMETSQKASTKLAQVVDDGDDDDVQVIVNKDVKTISLIQL